MQSVLSGRSCVYTSGQACMVAPTSGTELGGTELLSVLAQRLSFCLSWGTGAVQSPEWPKIPLGTTLHPSPYPLADFRL